jgi:hypothetical protein
MLLFISLFNFADYCVNGCAAPFVMLMALGHDKMPSHGF